MHDFRYVLLKLGQKYASLCSVYRYFLTNQLGAAAFEIFLEFAISKYGRIQDNVCETFCRFPLRPQACIENFCETDRDRFPSHSSRLSVCNLLAILHSKVA
jgi:hypothetical protein